MLSVGGFLPTREPVTPLEQPKNAQDGQTGGLLLSGRQRGLAAAPIQQRNKPADVIQSSGICKSTGAYCATSQNIYSIPTLHSDTTLSCQEYPPGSLTLKNGQAQAYTRTREHSFSVLLFPHPGTPANPTSSPQEPRPLASSQS